jgi:hypothetical protein
VFTFLDASIVIDLIWWDKNAAEELVTHMDRKLTCDESEDLEKDLTINEIKKIILVDCSLFSYQSTLVLNLAASVLFS